MFIIPKSTSTYFIAPILGLISANTKSCGIGLSGIRQQPVRESRPNSTSVQQFLGDGIDLDSELHLYRLPGD